MRKIVAGLFISLDGVVESPDKWHFPYFNDEMGAAVGGGMQNAGTMLLGRQTYEEFAAVWPTREMADDPGADFMNSTPKLVASTTLSEVSWEGSTLIEGDLATALTRVKQEDGKDLRVVGSPGLVRSLLREGLLDELELLVHPIVVGSGKRLFDGMGQQVPLRLTSSTTFGNGVLNLTYVPA